MAHVGFWQLGLHCVTAMLTPLPYNNIELYCANTKLNQFLFFDMPIALNFFLINAANCQYARKQSTSMIILLYTLLILKYFILQLYLVQCYHSTIGVQCYHSTIGFHNTSEAVSLSFTTTHYISHKIVFLAHTKLGGHPESLLRYPNKYELL